MTFPRKILYTFASYTHTRCRHKMITQTYTEQDAIDAALLQKWDEAIHINTVLLKLNKNNINVLNRLGFAYLQLGHITTAKKTFQKVIRLDEYNQIAIKNVKKLGIVRQKDLKKISLSQRSPMMFLEEPGKTKIVECVNTAPIQALSCACPGDEVLLKTKKHAVEVRTSNSVYLGALPDDIAFRLIKFISGGNTYSVHIKSVGKNSLVLFIRELTRGNRFLNQPSFASTGIYVPYAKLDSEKEDSLAGDDTADDSAE